MTIQKPFARFVQRLERPFNVIKVSFFQGKDRSFAETDRSLSLLNSGYWQARIGPPVHHYRLGFANGWPGLQIPGRVLKASMAMRPIRLGIQETRDLQITLVGVPRAHGSMTVHPKLAEKPAALL